VQDRAARAFFLFARVPTQPVLSPLGAGLFSGPHMSAIGAIVSIVAIPSWLREKESTLQDSISVVEAGLLGKINRKD
jgi:hypothetical protein